MKNITALLLTAFILVSCNIAIPGVTDKVLSDSDMSTQVAKILTELPTQAPAERHIEQTSMALTLTQAPGPSTSAVAAALPTEISTALPPSETPTSVPTVVPPSPTNPPPTSTPTNTITPTLGTNDPRIAFGAPKSLDPMDDPKFWGWGAIDDDFTGVTFKGGLMVLKGLTPQSGWRLPMVKPADNFYVEMTASFEKCIGKDNYGIIFRIPKYDEPNQGYLFSVTCDGYYKLWMWDGLADKDGAATPILSLKSSPAIRTGAGQSNRLGVLAVKDSIVLYINGTKVNETLDNTFSTGVFGVFVDPDTTQNLTIRVDEMSYWDNPTE